MNVRSGIAVAAVAGLALVPGAAAQKPPKPPKPPKPGSAAITIDARPSPVIFGQASTISGRLAGPGAAGVRVRLEQDATVPLGDRFEATPMATATANNGSYRFSVKPGVNTQYRVVASRSPEITSAPRRVSVRPLVGLRVSDPTPRRGSSVRFSGIVLPAHDGSPVSIQRRNSKGGWTTVARTPLTDAGEARSVYSRRIRVRSDGVYRVKLPGHNDQVNGFSRTRALDVQ